MRIISKKSDYYDSAQAFGQDQSVLYMRKERKVTLVSEELDILKDVIRYRPGHSGTDWAGSTIFVGFCGKIYPIFKMRLDFQHTYYAYNPKEIGIILNKRKWKDIYKYWTKFEGVAWRRDLDYFTLPGVTKYIKHLDTITNEYLSLFTKYDTPVFVLEATKRYDREWTLTINPSNLSTFNFGKVIDAYAAYQEIAMFMESALAHEKIPDPTNVPDRYLASAKGFDSWSFRKQPTKKGRKAKKRTTI